jgi:hypothetical protein
LRRIDPEPFKVIKGPNLNKEDVGHHIAVIHEYPTPVLCSLHTQGAFFIFFNPLLHVCGDRLDLSFRLTAAYNQIVRNGREVFYIE